MRCSDCSARVRPIDQCLDIDGTLADYHGSFIAFAEDYLGHALPRVYDGSTEFSESLGLDKQLYRDIKLAYRQGGQKRMLPVLPGVATLAEAVRSEDAELWLTTTRPWLRLDNIDPDMREWLRRARVGRYEALVYHEDKYRVLAEELVDPGRVVLVLDDLAEQVRSASEVGLPSLLRRTRWNAAHHRELDGVEDLYEAREVVRKRVAEWYANNTPG